MIAVAILEFGSGDDPLLSKRKIGEAPEMPEIGKPFHAYVEPMDLGIVNLVITSPVQKLEKINEGMCEFWTEEGHYSLCVMH